MGGLVSSYSYEAPFLLQSAGVGLGGLLTVHVGDRNGDRFLGAVKLIARVLRADPVGMDLEAAPLRVHPGRCFSCGAAGRNPFMASSRSAGTVVEGCYWRGLSGHRTQPSSRKRLPRPIDRRPRPTTPTRTAGCCRLRFSSFDPPISESLPVNFPLQGGLLPKLGPGQRRVSAGGMSSTPGRSTPSRYGGP